MQTITDPSTTSTRFAIGANPNLEMEQSLDRWPEKRGHDRVRQDRSRFDRVKKPCPKCGEIKVSRRARVGALDQILAWASLYPYRCTKCFHKQFNFVFSISSLGPVLFLLFALGTVGLNVYLAKRVSTRSASLPEDASPSAYRARTAAADLTPFERLMLSTKKQPLRNDDVVNLVRAGIAKELLLKIVSTSSPEYDLSPAGIVALKGNHIDDVVIMEMLSRTEASLAER